MAETVVAFVAPPPLTYFFLQKYMEDCEGVLNSLCDDMKAAVLSFTSSLRECARTHCDTNGSAIQKNVSRIGQDKTRLQDARSGIEALMQENDPFRFIEVQMCQIRFSTRLLCALFTILILFVVLSDIQDNRKTVEC